MNSLRGKCMEIRDGQRARSTDQTTNKQGTTRNLCHFFGLDTYNQNAVSRVRLTKEIRAKEPIPESESLKNFANPYQIKTQIYWPTLLISLIAMRPNFHFPIFCSLL